MWVDLSYAMADGMPVYPGDLAFRLISEKQVERDHYATFHLSAGLHAGTHADAPMHLLKGGSTIADMMLSRFAAPGMLIDARGQAEISCLSLEDESLRGKAVLLWTGMEDVYGTPAYYEGHPVVSMALCSQLIRAGIAFLGMDMPSPDQPPFPVHKALLAAGIPIVENMRNFKALTQPFEVFAFPLSLNAEASPVRAAARILEKDGFPGFNDKSFKP